MDIWGQRIRKLEKSIAMQENFSAILLRFGIETKNSHMSENEFRTELKQSFERTTNPQGALFVLKDMFLTPTIKYAGIIDKKDENEVHDYTKRLMYVSTVKEIINKYGSARTEGFFYRKKQAS